MIDRFSRVGIEKARDRPLSCEERYIDITKRALGIVYCDSAGGIIVRRTDA